jgi:hypothetical protein
LINQNNRKNLNGPPKPIPMVTSSLEIFLQNFSKIKTSLMLSEVYVIGKAFSLIMVITSRWWALYYGVRNLDYLQIQILILV